MNRSRRDRLLIQLDRLIEAGRTVEVESDQIGVRREQTPTHEHGTVLPTAGDDTTAEILHLAPLPLASAACAKWPNAVNPRAKRPAIIVRGVPLSILPSRISRAPIRYSYC